MKMGDVFALPVRRVGNTLADEGGYADGEDEADAAVHAINCHDGLVELAEMVAGIDTASPQALKYMAVALAEKARYELAKTKGE